MILLLSNPNKTSEWMIKHQEVFDALVKALSTAPILGFPNFFKEFTLETHASLNGLDAILLQ